MWNASENWAIKKSYEIVNANDSPEEKKKRYELICGSSYFHNHTVGYFGGSKIYERSSSFDIIAKPEQRKYFLCALIFFFLSWPNINKSNLYKTKESNDEFSKFLILFVMTAARLPYCWFRCLYVFGMFIYQMEIFRRRRVIIEMTKQSIRRIKAPTRFCATQIPPQRFIYFYFLSYSFSSNQCDTVSLIAITSLFSSLFWKFICFVIFHQPEIVVVVFGQSRLSMFHSIWAKSKHSERAHEHLFFFSDRNLLLLLMCAYCVEWILYFRLIRRIQSANGKRQCLSPLF